MDWSAAARAAAQKYGIDPDIFDRQMSVESIGYNEDVIYGRRNSPAGAQGIAQFMPATAAGLGINPLNPMEALDGAASLMSRYLKQYGNYRDALTAYNAGPGTVGRALPEETQLYHRKILGGGDGRVPQEVEYGGDNPSGSFTGTPALPTSQNSLPPGYKLIPIPGPDGRILEYILEWEETKTFDDKTTAKIKRQQIIPAKDVPGADTDSAAQTSMAATAAKNAASSRISALVNALDTMVKVQGMPAAEAMERFKAEMQKITLEQNQGIGQGDFDLRTADQDLRRTTAMNTDAREREIQEAQRQIGLQTIAAQRAQSAAKDILPSAIPGATSMNLPMLGEVPLPQVNLDQFYSQGLPSLVDQWNQPIASQAPNPWGEPVVAPQLPPLTLPTVPEPSPPIDVDAIMRKILGYA